MRSNQNRKSIIDWWPKHADESRLYGKNHYRMAVQADENEIQTEVLKYL